MEEDRQINQFTIFRLSNRYFGIDIKKVKEVINISRITMLPSSPDFVEGVINLRGKIIPIINLYKVFRKENLEESNKKRIIITTTEKTIYGLIVDEVSKILKVNEKDIEYDVDSESEKEDYIVGVIKSEERIVVLLDTKRLIEF